MTNPARILIGLLILLSVQTAYYYPRLPNPMAAHFDAIGMPNGWSSPESFFAMYLLVALILAGVMLGIGAFMRYLPPDMINVPNREYWMAEERRASTIRKLTGDTQIFGVGIVAFLNIVLHMVYKANVVQPPRLSNWFYFWLVAVMVGAVFHVIWVFRRYRIPE